MNRVLGKDEPDVTVFARRQLIADGVEIHEGIDVKQVAREGNAIAVTIAGNGAQSGSTTTISGSHLLVAAGRRATVEGLGLDAAGGVHSPRGIAVDARLRRRNRPLFAVGAVPVGDGLGGARFPHIAA